MLITIYQKSKKKINCILYSNHCKQQKDCKCGNKSVFGLTSWHYETLGQFIQFSTNKHLFIPSAGIKASWFQLLMHWVTVTTMIVVSIHPHTTSMNSWQLCQTNRILHCKQHTVSTKNISNYCLLFENQTRYIHTLSVSVDSHAPFLLSLAVVNKIQQHFDFLKAILWMRVDRKYLDAKRCWYVKCNHLRDLWFNGRFAYVLCDHNNTQHHHVSDIYKIHTVCV